MEPAVFSTKALLRPDQVIAAQEEIRSLEEKLNNRHIEDKAEVARQLRRARKDFESQAPQLPANGEEEGRMVQRSKELLASILEGMPSQEEMRKNPTGAVDKHRSWQERNKWHIAEWKHIQLRLTANSGERDAANLERHRPIISTLAMDSAQIPGKQFFFGPANAGLPVTFTDEQITLLKALDPTIAERLGTLTNRQRSTVKDILDGGIGLASEAQILGKLGAEKKLAKKKGRKPMTEEQKRELRERLAKARAARKGQTDAQ